MYQLPLEDDADLYLGQFRLVRCLYDRRVDAAVWAATNETNEEQVVLKLAEVTAVHESDDTSALQQMRNEHRILTGPLCGCFGTPSVVRFEVEDGVLVLAETPFGKSLTETVASTPRGAPRKQLLVKLGLLIAQILRQFDERGVVHGDVRPENIIIAPDGRPILIDYGLSSEAANFVGQEPTGSVQFADPELLCGGTVSFSTDLTSLLLTLHALETGLDDWYAQDSLACSEMARKLPADGAAACVRAQVLLVPRRTCSLFLGFTSAGIAVLLGLWLAHA
jgi:serine/threonine protein kinase